MPGTVQIDKVETKTSIPCYTKLNVDATELGKLLERGDRALLDSILSLASQELRGYLGADFHKKSSVCDVWVEVNFKKIGLFTFLRNDDADIKLIIPFKLGGKFDRPIAVVAKKKEYAAEAQKIVDSLYNLVPDSLRLLDTLRYGVHALR